MQRNDKIIYALYLSMWVKIEMCLPLNTCARGLPAGLVTFESDNTAIFLLEFVF